MYDEGIISFGEMNRLTREGESLLKEYGSTLAMLEIEVEATGRAAEAAYDAEAQAAMRAQEIRNTQMDSIRAYSDMYGIAADEIIDAASRMEGGLEAWAQKQSQLMTESGMNLEMFAQKWGMTTDEVEAYLEEWGGSLDDYNKRLKATHTEAGESLDDLAAKWGTTAEAISAEMAMMEIDIQEWSDNQDKAWEEYQKAVATHSDAVINSFEEIPAKYEMSASKMIETLRTNRERYTEWKQAMTEISGQVSAETLAELNKLGPGALSALEEMRANGGEKLREFDAEVRALTEESTNYVIQDWNDPALIGAPAAAFGQAGQQAAGDTSLPNAAAQQAEQAKAAFESVDFTVVGQGIANDITSGLNSVDLSGAMNGIANQIKTGSSTVTSAVNTMNTSVQTAFKTMGTEATTTVTQMMTTVNTAIF